MNNTRRSPRTPGVALSCGAALLMLATIAAAQYALDANLRVGSDGWNGLRRPSVRMSRSPYTVSSSGQMVYNRSVAFNDPGVYNSPMYRSQQGVGNFNPAPSGRYKPSASALARPPYSAGRSVSAMSVPVVQSVTRSPGSATLQRNVYTPGRNVNAMQIPTPTLNMQPYSVSSMASQTVRSR